eukprot:4906972-Lingulodinium_polyedra.AAC.1
MCLAFVEASKHVDWGVPALQEFSNAKTKPKSAGGHQLVRGKALGGRRVPALIINTKWAGARGASAR